MSLLARKQPARAKALFTRPRALVASAEPARVTDRGLRRLDQEWQREAMLRYNDTGEVWNPAQFYARAMERIRFYPALRSDRGDPQEIKDGPIFDLFNRIRSPGGAPGDLAILAGQYGRLHFVIGDGLLTVSDDEEGEEVWEYLSPMEMRLMPNSDPRRRQEYRRIRAPGITQEELVEAPDNAFEPLVGNNVRVNRLWRQHPAYSQNADSPIRPILELYALLHRLTLAVYAEASSRAAQRGLLYVPDELEIESVVPSQEENPEEDALIQEIVTSMERAIRDPASPEAMAPFILRGPGVLTSSAGSVSTADLIKWIALGPGDRYVEGEMWEKTISRIAGSLDMPKEMLTGIENVSHWCADEQTEILTETGWKHRADLNVGDIVLTLNHVSGESEWQPVHDIASFEVEDLPMLSIEGNCHSSLTSLDHRWPTIRKDTDGKRWRHSRDLNTNDFLVTGAPCAAIPAEPTYTDELVQLVAWVWTEGTMAHRPGRKNPRVHIYQSHTKNPENVALIRGALQGLYGPAHEGPMPSSRRSATLDVPRWNERQHRESTVFALNVAAAQPVVAVAPGKIVAREFIRKLTRVQLELFIETSMRADGSWRSNQRWLGQKNDKALEALELAAILLGTSIARRVRRFKGFTDHDLHCLAIHKRSRFGPKPKHKQIVRHTGTIWCPVTPNHTWLARRNGSVFYTGNSGWLLEEQGFRLHTGPTVVRFCNDVSAAYLRPAARDEGIGDADRAMIWFDPSQAVSHPDQTNTALKAHDQLLISDDYARDQIGAPDTAKPGAAELKRRTMIKLKEDPYADGADPRRGQTNPADGGTGGDVSKTPPAGPVERPVGNKPPAQNPQLSDLIVGAATYAVDRARELAGQRLWRRAQACEDCRDDARDVPRELIAFTLGRERVASVIAGHANEQSLVADTGDKFAARLRAWDVNNGWDEQLGQMVEQHALRTLYLEVAPPLPAGFVAACRRAVE